MKQDKTYSQTFVFDARLTIEDFVDYVRAMDVLGYPYTWGIKDRTLTIKVQFPSEYAKDLFALATEEKFLVPPPPIELIPDGRGKGRKTKTKKAKKKERKRNET